MQCVQRLVSAWVTRSGGGEKGKHCCVKWATDRIRLSVLGKPDEDNFLESGVTGEVPLTGAFWSCGPFLCKPRFSLLIENGRVLLHRQVLKLKRACRSRFPRVRTHDRFVPGAGQPVCSSCWPRSLQRRTGHYSAGAASWWPDAQSGATKTE